MTAHLHTGKGAVVPARCRFRVQSGQIATRSFQLHFHIRRVAIKPTSVNWQRGQATPSGHRIATAKSWHTCGSEKYRIVSTKVSGSLLSMSLINRFQGV